jgi:hypothetical protein
MFLLSGAIILGPPNFHGTIELINSVDDFLQLRCDTQFSSYVDFACSLSGPQYS